MTTTDLAPTMAQQAKTLLTHVAGYTGHRTIAIGLRTGLIRMLAEHPDVSVDTLADRTGLDPFYVGVWCRAVLAAGVCTTENERYRLAPHVETLLLDESSPAYVGGLFPVFEHREMFDRFEDVLPSGNRLWWDECSPEWISAVSRTGTPFYTRLVPGGLSGVPGLQERLNAGCRIVDTACGAGVGVVRLADHYPTCHIVGIDGDAHSVDLAAKRLTDTGLADRADVHVSPLEEMALDAPAALILNNISMHECRDIDRATANVMTALEPGGWFVISDFPFPDTVEDLQSVPGRIMSGIQMFEAQIDDQLLPRSAYDELLERHSFVALGHAELTPVHALTWGRRPE